MYYKESEAVSVKASRTFSALLTLSPSPHLSVERFGHELLNNKIKKLQHMFHSLSLTLHL